MKKKFLFALGICLTNFLFAQDSLNMTMLARWDDESLPLAFAYDLQYSGCWGMALNGREYAVLGGAAHVLFFDITEPTQPELIGKFAGTTTNTLWREFKSYKNRIYAVSDQSSEGLMIFDMTNAPDTVVRTYWNSEFFLSAHTITLDTTSGRIYLNGSNVAEMLVLDVSQDPDQPVFLAATQLAGGYIHDSYVRHDTVYASSGSSGYYIYDFTDPLHPDTLAAITTGGYNHNSWLNPEGTYAYYTEEIPAGRSVQIVDLQNLTNNEIEIAGSFLDAFLPASAGKPIPHNVYIKDHLLFNSQYEDGLVVYDISDPVQPVLVGHYDTHPQNTIYNGYYGNWGNYPWLPSGTIIAGDMQNGLQLLKLNWPAVGTNTPEPDLKVTIFPNPASDAITLTLPSASDEWSYRLLDPTGQALQTGQAVGNVPKTLSLKNCSAGLYFVEIQTNDGGKALRKIVVNP
jgi:choice-of-anchor B domain-containing protein